MKVKKVKGGKEERLILTAMIVDTLVLSRIAGNWSKKGGLFSSKWANLVGEWCVTFFNKYGKAPNSVIERLFDKWAKKSEDEETIKLVEQLLQTLSNQYAKKTKSIDTDIVLDMAEEYFNKVQLKFLAKQLSNKIEREELDDAEKLQIAHCRISLKRKPAVIIGENYETVKNAFAGKEVKSIVEYNGALRKFYGDFLCKNGFIAFLAKDKGGKSMVLLDMACRAWMQGLQVAYFDTGDMTESQVIRRIGSRVSGKPYRKQKYRYPIKISRSPEELMANVRFDKRKATKRLSVKEAWSAIETAREKGNGTLRLETFPAGTCSVRDIRAYLNTWKNESGFEPHLVVIDYADLLAPPPGINDFRHQINASWEQMRAISQEMDNLVVTATQANAASYKSELMGRWNFSEDKRKLAHVTGMVGLNSNAQEQDRQITRYNWIVLREGEYSSTKCVHVAHCLAISHPTVRSCW